MNGQKVIELTCAEVVPLIAQSGPRLDLVVSRRPSDTQLHDPDYATTTATVLRQPNALVDEPHLLDRRKLKEDDV